MEIRSFLTEIDLDDLFGIVPRTAGVGHKDGLKQSEEGDTNEIADKEIWVKERQGQGEAEDNGEDIIHAFLCVLGTNPHNLLAVFVRGRAGIEPHVLFDIDHSPIGAGHDCLAGGTSKPINDGSSHYQTKNNLR